MGVRGPSDDYILPLSHTENPGQYTVTVVQLAYPLHLVPVQLPIVPGGGGGTPPGYGWECADVDLRPLPLMRANSWWKIDPYLGQTFGEK